MRKTCGIQIKGSVREKKAHKRGMSLPPNHHDENMDSPQLDESSLKDNLFALAKRFESVEKSNKRVKEAIKQLEEKHVHLEADSAAVLNQVTSLVMTASIAIETQVQTLSQSFEKAAQSLQDARVAREKWDETAGKIAEELNSGMEISGRIATLRIILQEVALRAAETAHMFSKMTKG